MHALHARLMPGSNGPGRYFQRGPSYRSLCGRCNNELLGAIYDPALAHFCTEVRRITNTRLELPYRFAINVQPQLVMRSVLGHLAAMGVNRYRKGDVTEPFRDYMLDQTLPLPTQVRFYYWVYPFRSQVLIRDACISNLRSRVITLFWLMKFFPLAFLVTFDEPEGRQFQALNLDQFRFVQFDSYVPIDIQLFPLVHEHWPESPTDESFIMYGEQAVTIFPRNKIMRP